MLFSFNIICSVFEKHSTLEISSNVKKYMVFIDLHGGGMTVLMTLPNMTHC